MLQLVLDVNCISILCKRESAVRKIKVSIIFEMIDFQWGFNAIFMVPFSHYFNPRKCQRTRHKLHFVGHKNAVKRSEKYSENLHGPLKIPRYGENHDLWIFHPIKLPWTCSPWKIWICFMAFFWTPWKSHNKSNSWVIKKVMAFSCVLHCMSYNLDSLSLGH